MHNTRGIEKVGETGQRPVGPWSMEMRAFPLEGWGGQVREGFSEGTRERLGLELL